MLQYRQYSIQYNIKSFSQWESLPSHHSSCKVRPRGRVQDVRLGSPVFHCCSPLGRHPVFLPNGMVSRVQPAPRIGLERRLDAHRAVQSSCGRALSRIPLEEVGSTRPHEREHCAAFAWVERVVSSSRSSPPSPSPLPPSYALRQGLLANSSGCRVCWPRSWRCCCHGCSCGCGCRRGRGPSLPLQQLLSGHLDANPWQRPSVHTASRARHALDVIVAPALCFALCVLHRAHEHLQAAEAVGQGEAEESVALVSLAQPLSLSLSFGVEHDFAQSCGTGAGRLVTQWHRPEVATKELLRCKAKDELKVGAGCAS